MVFRCLLLARCPFLLLISCLSCNSEKHSSQVIPMETSLELGKIDSLRTVASFDIIPGSEHFIGNLSSISYDEDNIFITDFSQSLVFSLNRNDFYFERTFGNGQGGGPGNLNNPVNTIIYQDSILVEESQGANLYSYFSKDGSFIKSVHRENFNDLNVSFDKSFFIRDHYIYKTVGFADNNVKVKRYDITDPSDKAVPVVSLTDFGPYLDTSNIASSHPYMFIFPSKADTSIFFAASGSTLQVNIYNKKGALDSSFDLNNVEELSNYCQQMETLFSAGGSAHEIDNTLTTYFNGIVIDSQDRLIYPCLTIKNMDEVLSNLDSPDILEAEHYFIRIDIKNAMYDILSCQRNITPVKVIDNNLWCYDRLTSEIVIYELPN